MKAPASLQSRLALMLGLALSVLWLAATASTVEILRREIQEVFDSALQETAQRLLPLAVLEIVNRDEDANAQHLAPIRAHDELFTYIVRDAAGTVLMASHAADRSVFPDWDGPGFRETGTHRLYGEETLQGAIRLTVAEPLEIRHDLQRGILMRQAVPLLLALPLTLGTVWLMLRLGMAGVRRFRSDLEERDERELSPVPVDGLPTELRPMAETLNSLLARLDAAFEAERSFAANAAHELRTPLAGAIAQAQRIRQEAAGTAAAERAVAIEETLKRLTRTAERLMQLARAEGGQLKVDETYDIRSVLGIVIHDMTRTDDAQRVLLALPDAPVLSNLDPDVLGILVRNLVENALRHGNGHSAVELELSRSGMLSVHNGGPVVAAGDLERLTDRFVRGSRHAGSGLGLAIVSAIAGRMGASLHFASPRVGCVDGFSATVQLPMV